MNQLLLFAQKLDLANPLPGEGAGDGGASVLTNTLNLVYFLAAIVCVVVIIIAGYTYATSAGNSGRTSKAKNAILYAVIGIVVMAAAFTITSFVSGRVN